MSVILDDKDYGLHDEDEEIFSDDEDEGLDDDGDEGDEPYESEHEPSDNHDRKEERDRSREDKKDKDKQEKDKGKNEKGDKSSEKGQKDPSQNKDQGTKDGNLSDNGKGLSDKGQGSKGPGQTPKSNTQGSFNPGKGPSSGNKLPSMSKGNMQGGLPKGGSGFPGSGAGAPSIPGAGNGVPNMSGAGGKGMPGGGGMQALGKIKDGLTKTGNMQGGEVTKGGGENSINKAMDFANKAKNNYDFAVKAAKLLKNPLVLKGLAILVLIAIAFSIVLFIYSFFVTVFSAFVGDKYEQADASHRLPNVPVESHNYYEGLENDSYDKKYKNDEYDLRTSWSVYESIDSIYYDGKMIKHDAATATPDGVTMGYSDYSKVELIKKTLSPDLTVEGRKDGEPPVEDVDITYTWTKHTITDEMGNEIPYYSWDKEESRTPRKKIVKAVTWDGTFTRKYSYKIVDEPQPQNPSEGDTYHYSVTWNYEVESAEYNYEKLTAALKILADDFKKTYDARQEQIKNGTENPENADELLFKSDPVKSDAEIVATTAYKLISMQYPLDDGYVASKIPYLNFQNYIGGVFAWPVPQSATLTSFFGPRDITINGKSKSFHYGMDIGANPPGQIGDDILAVQDGVVTYAGWMGDGGNTIVIDHGVQKSENGEDVHLETYYMHLSSIKVSVGKPVTTGTLIGLMGTTGYSTGPHLHLAFRENGEYVDPAFFYHDIIKENDDYGRYVPRPFNADDYINGLTEKSSDIGQLARFVQRIIPNASDMERKAVIEVIFNRIRSSVYKYNSIADAVFDSTQRYFILRDDMSRTLNESESQELEHIKLLILDMRKSSNTNLTLGALQFLRKRDVETEEANFIAKYDVQKSTEYGNVVFYKPKSK